MGYLKETSNKKKLLQENNIGEVVSTIMKVGNDDDDAYTEIYKNKVYENPLNADERNTFFKNMSLKTTFNDFVQKVDQKVHEKYSSTDKKRYKQNNNNLFSFNDELFKQMILQTFISELATNPKFKNQILQLLNQ